MNKIRQALNGATSLVDDIPLMEKTGAQALSLLEKGQVKLSQNQIITDLIKSAKTLRNKSLILQGTGALTSAIGEARIEAYNGSSD
jgi:hypothetical protein